MKPFKRSHILCLIVLFYFILASSAYCQEWMPEFEEISSKVDIAETLSKEELLALIDRCDRLMTAIEASDDPKKKVYTFRVKKCRGVFKYIIDLKHSD